MRRKSIVQHLRDISDTAGKIDGYCIKNDQTGERIDFDAAFMRALIRSTLAYAVVLVDGRMKAGDAEERLTAIIQNASEMYVEQL